MPETFADFPFIYLYFQIDASEPPLYRSSERGQSQVTLPVPDTYLPIIENFRTTVKNSSLGSSGVVEFDGVRCRLSRQSMADGKEWICARRIASKIPELNELGYASHISGHLHTLGTRPGIILLAGASGHGKTTTACSLLIDFLKEYGGTAIAVEDPIEFNLKGRHGDKGQCFQIQPTSSEDWEACLQRTLTWDPKYIFAGTIKTPQVAEILLRAATTGHTILTTVDAGTPEDALIEVLYLAEQAMGPSASNILAQGLTALLFQTMKEDGPFIRYLFTEENAPGDPIRTLIREGKVTMISTYIDRIAARLSNQSPSPSPLPPLKGQSPLPGKSNLPPLPPLPPLPKKS